MESPNTTKNERANKFLNKKVPYISVTEDGELYCILDMLLEVSVPEWAPNQMKYKLTCPSCRFNVDTLYICTPAPKPIVCADCFDLEFHTKFRENRGATA